MHCNTQFNINIFNLSLNNQDGNLPDLRWNNNNLKWEIIVVFGCDQTPDTPDRYIFTTVWIWLKFQTKVLKMSNFTSLLIQENLLPAWSLNKHFLVGANWHKTWVICIYTNPQKVSVPYFPLHETWCEGWRCTAGVTGCHEVVLVLVTREILLRMLWTRRLGSPDNIALPSLANVPFIEFHPRVMTIETCILSKQNTEHLPLSPSLSRPEPTQSFVQLLHTFKKQEWRDRGEHCIRVEYSTANLHLQHVNFFKDWSFLLIFSIMFRQNVLWVSWKMFNPQHPKSSLPWCWWHATSPPVLPISSVSRQLLLNVNVNLVLPLVIPRDQRPAPVTGHVSPGVCRIIATLNPGLVEL